MASSLHGLLLLAHAVKFASRSDEKIPLRNRDGGAELVVALIAHGNDLENFEFSRCCDDEDFTLEVLEINFSVCTCRRTFNLRPYAEIASPIHLACGRVNARKHLAFAVQDVETSFVKQRRGNVARKFPPLALPQY